MGAYIITKHPRPFGTTLQNHKKVREELILSFNPAQQQFLRTRRWKFCLHKGYDVKIYFPYYFIDQEDTVFRLLFGNYKLFNYSSSSISSFFSYKPQQKETQHGN